MKKSLLRKNLMLSLGFGICVGLLFPLYSLVFVEFKSSLMMAFFIAGCLVAGILVGIVAYLVNTETIVRVARRINAVMEENPEGRAVDPEELRTDSDDVLGRLIDNFRVAIIRFQDSHSQLRNTASRAYAMSDEVSENLGATRQNTQILFRMIGLIGDATGELDKQNELMEKGFDQLNKSTLLNVANIIELYTSIDEFGNTIFRQTESINQLVETLHAIEKDIGSDGDAEAKRTLSALSANLGKRVQDTIDTSINTFRMIQTDLDSIDGIAERTNVLSINASIEAARLGREGAGFRIIATSIKQLAGEVHALTERIGGEMASGERQIGEVTGALHQAIDSQTGIISGIKDSISALSQKNEAVTTQMRSMEQNRAQIDALLKDIKANMQKLKDFVAETRESLSLVVNTSTVIHSGVATMSEKSAGIEENENRVTASLDLFRKQVGEIKA